MTFKHFVIVMAIATLAVLAGWFVVLVSIDPTETGVLGFVFFYVTLAVTLIGLLTILGTAVRRMFNRKGIVSRQVLASMRQSILFSILIISALIMISYEALTLWTIMLLILVLAVIELIFLSSTRPREAYACDLPEH